MSNVLHFPTVVKPASRPIGRGEIVDKDITDASVRLILALGAWERGESGAEARHQALYEGLAGTRDSGPAPATMPRILDAGDWQDRLEAIFRKYEAQPRHTLGLPGGRTTGQVVRGRFPAFVKGDAA
jgi:hypothetical protein